MSDAKLIKRIQAHLKRGRHEDAIKLALQIEDSKLRKQWEKKVSDTLVNDMRKLLGKKPLR